MEKAQIRIKKLSERDSLLPEEIKSKSALIQNKIYNSDIFKKSESVFCYINIRSEVESLQIINLALDLGKTVAIPITVDKRGKMYFSEIKKSDLDNLREEKYGLLEPIRKQRIEPDEKTLFIIPGAAYDLYGNRVGYGAGYYDRYLKNRKHLHLLGVCFDIQITETIDFDPFDVKMDSIVTENRWIFPDKTEKTIAGDSIDIR
ncbi:MAG: 5-formyltetrahydrofolate cyclo-ligase [Methanosarcinaceae archaeon]|nr:5-formyltetrahydrofolate cyclo-ligase [Methanosarcinaceae archaeon]